MPLVVQVEVAEKIRQMELETVALPAFVTVGVPIEGVFPY